MAGKPFERVRACMFVTLRHIHAELVPTVPQRFGNRYIHRPPRLPSCGPQDSSRAASRSFRPALGEANRPDQIVELRESGPGGGVGC